MNKAPSGIDALVDRQVKRWNAEKKRRNAERDTVPVYPCITISRQYGALGGALGKALATELGYSCWDQELVHAIARESGLDEQLLSTVDEQTRNSIDVFIDSLLRGRTFSGAEYLAQLGRLIQTIAAHGSSIIVGRGGQFLLNRMEALHVRTVCPIEFRVRGIAQRRGISETEARSVLERGEKERHAFIQKHYGRDVTDPTAYDLIINMATTPVDKAAQIVKTAYEARFGDQPERRVERNSLPPLRMPAVADD